MTEVSAELNPAELGKRLQRFRKLNGRTQLQIAEALGISRPSVAAIESGQRRIDSRLLLDLARAYTVPLSALVRQAGPRATLQAQFRLPADATGTVREELQGAIASLETLSSNYLQVEQLLGNPLRYSPVPRYGYESGRLNQDAEGVAEAERRRLGIGDGPAHKLRGLLERDAGLRIFHVPLPSSIAGLYGFSEDAGPCVAINANHPLVRERWSLAHEFGHFLTRLDRPEVTRVSRYQRVPEQERFAEQFAAAFLMPRSGLERRVRELESGERRISVADLLLMAYEFEVSLQALALRLEEIRVVPPGTWDALTNSGVNIKAASQMLGIQPAASDTQRLPRRFTFLALEAYARELFTERELADVLGLDRLSLRRVLEQVSSRNFDLSEDTAWDIPLSESMSLEIEPEPVAVVVDADVLMNLLATGCAAEILQSLNILLLVPPTVASEALYLESEASDLKGGERELIDLSPLENASLLARLVLEDREVDLVVDLAQIVDDGEAEVIAVALARNIAMATDDRKARRVAAQRVTSLLSTPELLHRWQSSTGVADQRMIAVLRQVRRRSHYGPPANDALFQWWMNLLASG